MASLRYRLSGVDTEQLLAMRRQIFIGAAQVRHGHEGPLHEDLCIFPVAAHPPARPAQPPDQRPQAAADYQPAERQVIAGFVPVLHEIDEEVDHKRDQPADPCTRVAQQGAPSADFARDLAQPLALPARIVR